MGNETAVKNIMAWIKKHPNAFSTAVGLLALFLSLAFLRKGNYIYILLIVIGIRIGLGLIGKETPSGDHNKKESRNIPGMRDILKAIGFQEIEFEFVEDNRINIKDIVETIYRFKQGIIPSQWRQIYKNYTSNFETELTSYIFSFALPKCLLKENLTFKDKFLEEIRNGIAEDIVRSSAIPIDDTLKSQVKAALLLEIWFADIQPSSCYWLMKPYLGGERIKATHGVRLKPEGIEKGVALLRHNYQSADGSFDIDEKNVKSIFNKNIPIIVGPETLETGVIDIYSKNVVGSFSIAEIIKDWQDVLCLDIVHYNSPFKMIDRWIMDKGGYIEVIGYYNAGTFHSLPTKHSHPLSKTLRNIMQSDPVPMVSGISKVENLLQEFILENRAIVKNVLASEGNFEIVYKETRAGYKRQYHIKRLNWNTKYCEKDEYETEIYKDPAHYHAFKFDQENLSPIPFTEGYLMTGSSDNCWLCFFVSAGSPAASGGDGFEINADEQLTSVLYAYAQKNNITNLILVNEATQGLVAIGNQGNNTLYLKLLNPYIVNFYYSKEIIRTLVEKDIIPPIVQVKEIDRGGQEVPKGTLIFQTPELKSLAEIINKEKLGFKEKKKYLYKLTVFSQGLLHCNILCTDFTLKDTVEYNEGGKEYIFVCDYGSYIRFHEFIPGNLICKPEYESPEDRHEDIGLIHEPYQVYKLGILFYQVIMHSSYQFPGLNLENEESYIRTLEKAMDFLSSELPPYQEDMVNLIKSMLNSEPRERPTLQEIIESMRV